MMTQNNCLTYTAIKTIHTSILNLLTNNQGYAKQEFSSSELQRLSKQIANGIQIHQSEIIGLYDGSIANSFSGDFSGILFLKDRVYVNIHKSSKSECMLYADMVSISGTPSSFFATLVLTSIDGDKIMLKGLAYTTPTVYATFEDIIKVVRETANTESVITPNSAVENIASSSISTCKEENDNPKESVYKKTTTLLLNVFKELCGDSSFFKGEDISDKKNKKLIKEYGCDFSKEKILFCDKFMIFAPSFVVTTDHFRSYSFNDIAAPNHTVSFKKIKRIRYNLMPTKTNIEINLGKWDFIELYNGVPKAETYSDVRSYEKSVNKGTYKSRTICYLATIYALTALYNATDEYESVYLDIERNIKKLIEYQKDTSDISKKYGNFFSFDFVTCHYEENEVENALEFISSVKVEVRAEEIQERKEAVVQALEKKFDETREQYERQQRK